MESVRLRGREVRQASRLACGRVKGKRNNDVAAPEEYSGPSIIERDFIGTLAELAVASYYDLTVNTDTSGPDSGYDFLVHLNKQPVKIDVKGYRHQKPRLLVEEGNVTADYYIHTRVNLDEISVNCAEMEYSVSPNNLVIERLSRNSDGTNQGDSSLSDKAIVDLLGWAPKQLVLDAEVMTHESDPSHTIPKSDLEPLPNPSSIQPFTSRSWFVDN